ncbi:MAG: YvcK family protein [Chloroflexi bacterium]|nr:YvcK family protein [Chloroflexota bacterium]
MADYRDASAGVKRAARSSRLNRNLKEALALFLLPGTGMRRWILLGASGGLVFALGVGYMVRAFSSVAIPNFLPGAGEAIFFLILATVSIATASGKLMTMVSSARVASLPEESLRDSMLRIRERARAPRFVAIGGGTGLSALLRGLKEQTRLTGIVTVADDGGSSGRLRDELGLLPPGDIRNCIVALADAEPLMKDLFQYRFPEGSGLAGHSFGNLFIAAMSGVTGSFEDAVAESSRILNVHGKIVPSTLDNVRLAADMSHGKRVHGETNITLTEGSIKHLYLEPESPAMYEGAGAAIESAQMIIIGPGSLYTSIIPNLLVPGLTEAISNSKAPVVYICNVASQPGETDNYTVADHVRAILSHRPDLNIDYVIANADMTDLHASHRTAHVELGDMSGLDITVVEADLLALEFRTHHDSKKLAEAIMAVYHESVGGNGRQAGTFVRNGGNGNNAGEAGNKSKSSSGALAS